MWEGGDEDEKQVSTKKQKRDDEELKDKAGATAVPPPRIGKREGENEDEKQVGAKKQKRDEVAEEQKNKEEIVLDDSFSDSEPDKTPVAKQGSPGKQEKKGKPASANCSSSLESLAVGSEEDEGNMDIDEGDYSEESDEETQEKKMEVLVDAAPNAQECELKNVENDSFSDRSDDDDNGNDNSSDVIEKRHIVTNPLKSPDSSENSEEGIDEKASKTPPENDVETVGAASVIEPYQNQSYNMLFPGILQPKTLVMPKEENAGSRTIYTKNLSYSVERADLESLFKDCGEIVDVRLHTDYEGRFRGFGHVEFATAEAAQKALQLNNTELLRCPIRVGLAREKRKYIPNRSFHDNNFRNSFQRSERFQPVKGSEISRDCEQETEEKASKTLQKSAKDMKMVGAASIGKKAPKMLATWQEQNATSKTIYCRNLSYSVVRDDMEIFFEECGEIVDIRLHTDHEGRIKGYGHVEFATTEAAQKALQLNNTVFLGRRIGVGIAHEKKEYTSYRSNWSKSFHQSERTQPIKSTQSSEYCEEEIEGKASESPWESSKRLATLKEQNAQPKTIYVRNLSYSVEPADMENLFKVCGKIVDIRLHTDHKGRLNGFGKVEFATEEAAKKALEFDNIELLRRPIGVYLAREKGDYTYNRSNWSNSFQRCDRNQSRTIFVKGFNSSLPTEEIKASLEEHFGYCGEIARISVRKSHDFGAIKGFAHLEFKDVDSAQKALHLDQTKLEGYALLVEKAKPQRDNQGIGGDGGGYSSRVGWGRSGGGGWHSSFYHEDTERKNDFY